MRLATYARVKMWVRSTFDGNYERTSSTISDHLSLLSWRRRTKCEHRSKGCIVVDFIRVSISCSKGGVDNYLLVALMAVTTAEVPSTSDSIALEMETSYIRTSSESHLLQSDSCWSRLSNYFAGFSNQVHSSRELSTQMICFICYCMVHLVAITSTYRLLEIVKSIKTAR